MSPSSVTLCRIPQSPEPPQSLRYLNSMAAILSAWQKRKIKIMMARAPSHTGAAVDAALPPRPSWLLPLLLLPPPPSPPPPSRCPLLPCCCHQAAAAALPLRCCRATTTSTPTGCHRTAAATDAALPLPPPPRSHCHQCHAAAKMPPVLPLFSLLSLYSRYTHLQVGALARTLFFLVLYRQYFTRNFFLLEVMCEGSSVL
jgi:hypothetical protein